MTYPYQAILHALAIDMLFSMFAEIQAEMFKRNIRIPAVHFYATWRIALCIIVFLSAWGATPMLWLLSLGLNWCTGHVIFNRHVNIARGLPWWNLSDSSGWDLWLVRTFKTERRAATIQQTALIVIGIACLTLLTVFSHA